MKRIGIFAASVVMGAAAHADVKTSGFVDAHFDWTRDTSNSFTIHDGAAYLSAQGEGSSVMVDLPFHTSGTNNDFSIATHKAQAYVTMKNDDGLKVQLGQFDLIFGAEAKDTVGIAFSHHSVIDSQFGYDTTQTGLLVGYEMGDFGVDVFYTNNAGEGTRADGSFYDIGGKITGRFEDMGIEEISFGGMYQKIGDASNVTFVSGVLGLRFGDLHLRGDGTYRKVKGGETELGAVGEAIYDVSSEVSGGVRFGLVDNGAPYKMEVTVGPQFHVTKNLTAKVDYSFLTPAADGADKVHQASIAGVMSF